MFPIAEDSFPATTPTHSGAAEQSPRHEAETADPLVPLPATANLVPASPARPALGPPDFPERFGRYRLVKCLGKGGMGTVYLAHDTDLDRDVALKVPHVQTGNSELIARFHREARAAAALNHPNICPIYDVGSVGDQPYLTMAYVEGRSLADHIKQAPECPPDRAAALVRELALALNEAHRHGVIHRDLKPSNIMINERGAPVVMDFGLARLVRDKEAALTRSGQLLGTPAYMAPEQAQGVADAITPACDIYSLGVILYELLTGHQPFVGPLFPLLHQLVSEEPPTPLSFRPNLDPRLDAICRKAMAKEASARYASMAQFADALTTYLQPTTPTLLPTMSPGSPVSTSAISGAPTAAARWWLPMLSAVLLLLAATAAVLFLSVERGDRPSSAPANRPAPAVPGTVAPSEYAQAQVLAHLRTLAPEDRRHIRYLSIPHLQTEGGAPAEVDRHRLALAAMFQRLARQGPSALVAIDGPTGTVFALDLRMLGWHRQPFECFRGVEVLGPSPLNLFDLALLEYPYALWDESSDTLDALAREYVIPAALVRPVPCVRSDWFVSVCTQPPLAAELWGETAHSLELPVAVAAVAHNYRETPVTLAMAADELGLNDDAPLVDACRRRALKQLGLGPLATGSAVSRSVWAAAFAETARQLKRGIPLLPSDGLTWPDLAVLGLSELELVTNHPDNQFRPRDELEVFVRNRSDSDLLIELIGTSVSGQKVMLTGPAVVPVGGTFRFPQEGRTIQIQDELGKEQITLLAVSAQSPAFPPGELLRGKGFADRVVHPWYRLEPREGSRVRLIGPTLVMKKTIVIETQEQR